MLKPHAMSVRLTDEGDALIRAASKAKGISKAAVIELAIREYAKANGITAPAAERERLTAPSE